MGDILNELARLSEVNFGPGREYANIVYDLSPGADEFTETLLELLVERKKNKQDTIDLYYVTTLDNAHIEATIQHLKRLKDKADHNIAYFNGSRGEVHVHVVVNELPTRYDTRGDITLDKLAEALHDSGLDCDIWCLDFTMGWAGRQTYHFVKFQDLIERIRKAREAREAINANPSNFTAEERDNADEELTRVTREIIQYGNLPEFSGLHAILTAARPMSSAGEDSQLFTALLRAPYRQWIQPPRVPVN